MVAAAEFEAHRGTLFGLAYRMLGDRAEAEDIVQEAFLRQSSDAATAVASVRAYLCTIVTRLCLDHLKSARVRRESYVGPWLPEPLPTHDGVDRETLSTAFLLLLERLSPVERAAFLLHDVFDYTHAEVADILGETEANCRQIAHRARAHVDAGRPRFAGTRAQHERLLGQFLQACAAGDLEGLRRLLADDAATWSDGGGKVQAARKVVVGADAVAKLWVHLARRAAASATTELAELNGNPALLLRLDGRVVNALSIVTDGERITTVLSVANPDKLLRLSTPTR